MGSSFSNSDDLQPRGYGPPPGSGGRDDDLQSFAVPVSHRELRRWLILDQLPLALDLLPSRGHPLGMLLTGAAAISIVVGLFLGLGSRHPSWTAEPLPAFTLDGPGNVGSWFSTLVLTAAGLCCLIVWWLEGIAADEDTGPSKAWLLGALVCFLMGLDESVGLHTLLTGFLVARADRWGEVSPQFAWMLLYGLVLLGFGIRVLPAMAGRRSILAILFLIGAGAAYLLSALVQAVPQFPLPFFPNRELWEEVPELAGHWLVLTAFTCHAQRLLRGLLQDDRGGDPDTDSDARLHTFRELLWRRGEESPSAERPSDSRGIPGGVDAALARGDFLIIHPPHGRNRSRAVKRVIRRRTAATGRTKRSDLDPPVIVAPVISPAPSFGSPAAQQAQPAVPTPAPSNSGGLNAFLAGMAYAETQRATAQPQSAAVGISPTPQSAAWGNQAENAVSYGPQPQLMPVSQPPQSAGVNDFRVLPSSAGFPSPTTPAPSQNAASHNGDPRYANGVYSANPSRIEQAHAASPPIANTTYPARNPFSVEAVPPMSQSSETTNAAFLKPNSVDSGRADPSPVGGVSRKLTKEEKKRLRELYERRLAQQGQSAGV